MVATVEFEPPEGGVGLFPAVVGADGFVGAPGAVAAVVGVWDTAGAAAGVVRAASEKHRPVVS